MCLSTSQGAPSELQALEPIPTFDVFLHGGALEAVPNPDDPNREAQEPTLPDPDTTAPDPGATPPDPGATVPWDPADIPGLGEGREAVSGAPSAPTQPPDPGATIAWNPEDIAQAVESEAAEAVASEDDEDPLVGTMLRDKWKVLQRLGAGAFGTVYKVEDVAGGWVEAMKILGVDKLTGTEGENMKKRFLREAQIMKRLGKESKHIVGLSAYEEDLDAGLIYLVMEYVEGRPLSKVIEEDGPFSVERAIKVGLHVCDALIAAHAEPVVHRDMKLDNVMMTLDRNGEEVCKVLDFGIAKIAEKETDSRLTTVGTLGTPGYAAPEQLRAEAVDGRTDLFAFGVILYELLTGHDPWLSNLAHTSTTQIYELMVATERGDVRPWADTGVDVPPAMQNVVMKLMRRDPDQRYQTAEDLRDALLRVEEGAADVEAGSLRVLTDEPGVGVEVRSGRSVIAEGPTPCVVNAVSAGTYKVRVTDERFEPMETSITLDAGSMEDLTIVATPRTTGVGASARRNPASVAAAVLILVAGGVAVVLQPWGRTMDVADVEAKAANVTSAWLTEAGIEGQLAVGPLPAPFRVPLADDAKAAAVQRLRSAGLNVDTSWEVARLLSMAGEAQAQMRYFGSGNDVRSYAAQIATLDPESAEARSLTLKVAERMAWDAQAARSDGAADQADALILECLAMLPGHPGCVSAQGGG